MIPPYEQCPPVTEVPQEHVVFPGGRHPAFACIPLVAERSVRFWLRQPPWKARGIPRVVLLYSNWSRECGFCDPRPVFICALRNFLAHVQGQKACLLLWAFRLFCFPVRRRATLLCCDLLPLQGTPRCAPVFRHLLRPLARIFAGRHHLRVSEPQKALTPPPDCIPCEARS